jgi:hypothetical protein
VSPLEIFKMHIPDISHGSKTVTDMKRIRHGQNPLGNAMAGADHKVIAFKIKLFDSHGKEREIGSVIFRNTRNPLKERGSDLHFLDDFGQLAFDVDQCVKVRIGIEFAEDLKDPLSSPHSREPVMNERDLQPFPPLRHFPNRPFPWL